MMDFELSFLKLFSLHEVFFNNVVGVVGLWVQGQGRLDTEVHGWWLGTSQHCQAPISFLHCWVLHQQTKMVYWEFNGKLSRTGILFHASPRLLFLIRIHEESDRYEGTFVRIRKLKISKS